MATWIFDIETNALLDELDRMHCIVAKEFGTNNVLIGNVNDPVKMKQVVRVLEEADEIVAHNAFGFDVPALDMLYGFKPQGKVIDTLVLGRLIWPNIREHDYGRAKTKKLPARLIGSHSLEAYGYRLGVRKGEYGKRENAWDHWSQEMEDYCIQDVNVLCALYQMILNKNYSQKAIDLELGFAWIISRQERHGFLFDERAAIDLMVEIRERQSQIADKMKEVFPTIIVPLNNGKVFTSKVNRKRDGLVKGAEYCKIDYQEFNPNSRQHIAERFRKKYNWIPTQLTETGIPVINEQVLESMDFPEAKLLSEYLLLTKRIGMLADGNQAWLKAVGKDGRIHGRVNTNGAVSGRCTHSSPNVAQVPAVYSPYGEKSRSLFRVPAGKKLVGCDASGLELRGLAHYLAGFDGGEYARKILEGDIHTTNQEAAGLATRNQAKTFIYAFIYGAGDAKIGQIVESGDNSKVRANSDHLAKVGKKLKESFYLKVPALRKLQNIISNRMSHPNKKQRVLKGLDGREYTPRSEHSALNLLIQGAGAVIMKQALINADLMFQEEGWIPGKHYEFVANIHDEYQIEIDEDKAERCKELSVAAIRKAGIDLRFKCPLDGEAKIGGNWAETH